MVESNKFKEKGHHVTEEDSMLLNVTSHFLSNISAEPTYFLTILASIMNQLISQNLYLEKACRVDIGLNSSVCDALTIRNASGYSKEEEVDVQKLVSTMLGMRTLLQNLFPFCLMLFIGSWTDRHKRRKPLILLPIIGEILSCIFLIFNVIFFHELPLIYTTLGESLPSAMLGGLPCLVVGVYTYIGEKCDQQSRTIRIGILSAAEMIAFSIAMGVAGFIHRSIGFIGFFSISIFLQSSAVLLGMILVKEKFTDSKCNKGRGLVLEFFNIHHFTDSLKVCFKYGRSNKRLKVIVVLIMAIIITGCMYGEIAVNYLYTRLKFGWNSIQYGVFTCTMLLVDLSGTILAVAFFSKFLGYDDSFLGIVGLTGSVIGNTVYAFAPNGLVLYLGIICDFCRITAYIAIRSIMTKVVPPEELGQSNSVFGICESIAPLIFGPLYTTIFNLTINYFPGMYFLVTVALKFSGLCMFVCLYILALKEMRRDIKTGRNSLKCDRSSKDEINEESIKMMPEIQTQ